MLSEQNRLFCSDLAEKWQFLNKMTGFVHFRGEMLPFGRFFWK
jgi:hypothetical protein